MGTFLRTTLRLCKDHTGWVITLAGLIPASYASYALKKEKVIMEIVKFWIVSGGLWIPLTVYFLCSKLPGVVEFYDRHTEIKRRRKQEDAEREARKKREKWKDLVATIGHHKEFARNVSKGDPLRFPEDFEKQRNQIIHALEEYKFSVPSKEDLLTENFDKCSVQIS